MPTVDRSTPPGSMIPIGPYAHISTTGPWITIGGVAGVDPATGELAGPDVAAQTRQILEAFRHMLATVHSDFDHVLHINVFLLDMAEFDEMNRAYAETIGDSRPSRTAIGVVSLPKPGARLTMNLTAVRRD